MTSKKARKEKKLLRLDFGCGQNKKEGFKGVDIKKFDGVDIVFDLTKPWPWKNNSVSEAHASHFIEHLTVEERIHFVNELYRVLVPGGKCQIICPNWASNRAYGDLTHKWPPVCEMWYFYLSKEWRKVNAPHNDFYTCDFDSTGNYALHPSLIGRPQEYQIHALSFWKEAAQDIITTVIKRVPDAVASTAKRS